MARPRHPRIACGASVFEDDRLGDLDLNEFVSLLLGDEQVLQRKGVLLDCAGLDLAAELACEQLLDEAAGYVLVDLAVVGSRAKVIDDLVNRGRNLARYLPRNRTPVAGSGCGGRLRCLGGFLEAAEAGIAHANV